MKSSNLGAGWVVVSLVCLAVLGRSAGAQGAPLGLVDECEPSWRPTFGEQPGTGEEVDAMAVFDDGSGPALFVGGRFRTAGGVVANHIAKWDGTSWSSLGSGIDGTGEVQALVVFDDGSGPALYVGGNFVSAGGVTTGCVAKWDGTSWSSLAEQIPQTFVAALAVYDDGSGPALYAAGDFTSAGGVADIAKWTGTGWAHVGSWVQGTLGAKLYALTVFDDGGGSALYVGGHFTSAGGVPANYIAKFDGTSWSALGTGTDGDVISLASFDDGGGPALYVGGPLMAGGVTVHGTAKWDGTSWSALAGGVDARPSALASFDDGTGAALYAGLGVSGSSNPTSRIVKWNGTSWSNVPGIPNGSSWVNALLPHDDGSGPALFVGGRFGGVSGKAVNNLAKRNASGWAALGNGINGGVGALTVFDDGGGPVLYASGFTTAGGVAVKGTAKWNGSGWAPLGSITLFASALTGFDAGSGPVLYASSAYVPYLSKWDGTQWSTAGGLINGSVYALTVFDDGGGPALYAGGRFTSAGGGAANRIVKWDGSSWSTLGSGLSGGITIDVQALTVFDDGSGPALYVAGDFTTAGGVSANRIARWDGASWSALGSGMDLTVYALTVFDDGSGPALYAGGNFTTAGGVAAHRIAKWDGSSWSAVGSTIVDSVRAMTVFDDGRGPALYAAGDSGVAANRIAKWDGTSWSPLGSGTSAVVEALAVFDDGTGPALFVGGAFGSALDSHDSYLAKWGFATPDTTPPTLFCPTALRVADRVGSPPGEIVHFVVSASDCRDSAPNVVCVPPSGSLFPPGKTTVTCTATDAAGNTSVCQFPVIVVRGVRPP